MTGTKASKPVFPAEAASQDMPPLWMQRILCVNSATNLLSPPRLTSPQRSWQSQVRNYIPAGNTKYSLIIANNVM